MLAAIYVLFCMTSKNIDIIILFDLDGSNLRYLLYHWCPGMNDCFGGDYAKFYGYVTDFFTK